MSELDRSERGKRKTARWILGVWSLASTFVFWGVVFGSLEPGELESLLALYKTLTVFTGVSSLGLFGLDATGVQIIPAIRGTAK